ncbi:MAG: hypothetical protein ACRD7E_03920 [Bryobacteraceae bacterium]
MAALPALQEVVLLVFVEVPVQAAVPAVVVQARPARRGNQVARVAATSGTMAAVSQLLPQQVQKVRPTRAQARLKRDGPDQSLLVHPRLSHAPHLLKPSPQPLKQPRLAARYRLLGWMRPLHTLIGPRVFALPRQFATSPLLLGLEHLLAIRMPSCRRVHHPRFCHLRTRKQRDSRNDWKGRLVARLDEPACSARLFHPTGTPVPPPIST